MFTGIVRHQGTVVAVARRPHPRLSLRARGIAARRGDSVAVDGVCLTVVSHRGPTLVFDLVDETLRVTTLGLRRPGDRVNVEPALRVGDALGGHLLLGHVDARGRLIQCRRTRTGWTMTVAYPLGLRRYLTPKGSIAVDGVSLTVAPPVTRTRFTVHLIPETVASTTLGARRSGDLVNLEVDPLARYVAALMPVASSATGMYKGLNLRKRRRSTSREKWLISGLLFDGAR